MCAVSMVSDFYNQRPVMPTPVPWPSGIPYTLPWTPEALSYLKDILKRLDDLDKKLGLAHCEDPKKALWMKSIEKRVAKMEQAQSRRNKRNSVAQ